MKTATDRHFRLASGLGLSLLPRDGSRFAAALVIPGGFRHDAPAHPTGMNHLLEHLTFRGGDGVNGASDRAEVLARKGLGVNGWTDLERAVFWASGPAAHSSTALEFLTGLLGEPKFTADDLRHELEVIRQEVAGRPYTPWDVHRDVVLAMIAQEEWERVSAQSNLEGLSRLSYDEVRAAAAARMQPERGWLVVASPDPERDIAAAGLDPREELPERQFNRPEELPPPPMPRVYTGRIKKAEQVNINRCFHYRPARAYSGPAMWIISDVLGGSGYGELTRRLRQAVPLSYETGTTSIPLNDVSGLVLYAVVARSNVEPALRTLNELTRQYREQGITRAAFEEAHARLLQGVESLDAEPEASCQFVADSVLVVAGQAPLTPHEYLERARVLDHDTVNNVCAGLMRADRTITSIVGDIGWWRGRKLAKLAQDH